jgi:TPR repeat protein
MYEKGEGVPVDRAEAGRWYCRAADLAFDALDGDFEGSGWDIDAVTDIFQKGAEYGHARAQGVTVDYYRAGADRGSLWRQFELGSLYSRGQWVSQDYVQAHMWFNLAASTSTGDDQQNYASARDVVAAKMTHDQIAEAQRLAREWRPTSEDEG